MNKKRWPEVPLTATELRMKMDEIDRGIERKHPLTATEVALRGQMDWGKGTMTEEDFRGFLKDFPDRQERERRFDAIRGPHYDLIIEDDVEEGKRRLKTFQKVLDDFNKYISLPPQMGPPYMTKGIGDFMEIKKGWCKGKFDYKPKRRLRMLYNTKERIKRLEDRVEELKRALDREIAAVAEVRGSAFLVEHVADWENEIHSTDKVVRMILDHLGITLKTTAATTELVSVTKKRKKSRKKTFSVDKSKKKRG